jgi:hypothetical protein
MGRAAVAFTIYLSVYILVVATRICGRFPKMTLILAVCPAYVLCGVVEGCVWL